MNPMFVNALRSAVRDISRNNGISTRNGYTTRE